MVILACLNWACKRTICTDCRYGSVSACRRTRHLHLATGYARLNGQVRPKAGVALNPISCGQMMARTYIRNALLSLLFASIFACSYETRHVQYSLAVRPMNDNEAVLMRVAVRDFANASGFTALSEAGMADYLRAGGSYVYSFETADKSYISVINVVNPGCYDIGIHSNVSATAAQALGERLREILRSTVSTEVTAESACNGKH